MTDHGGLRGYRLAWKPGAESSPGDIEGDDLRPDALGLLAPAEALRTGIRVGNAALRLGDLFSIEETGNPSTLEIPGSPRFLRLAAGLGAGTVLVAGPAGDRAGEGLRGGELRILGAAGHGAGAGMTGGTIHVQGDAGDNAGGPPADADCGMSGGEIFILGNAGAGAALRMRRGLIAVAGSAGPQAGYAMLAGTAVFGRGRADLPGLLMARGSLVFLDPASGGKDWSPGPHAREECAREWEFLRILERRLRSRGFPAPAGAGAARYALHSADHDGGGPAAPRGRGEIFSRLPD